MKTGDRVTRNEPDNRAATVLAVTGSSARLAYDEGGEGWWPISSLTLLDPPDWAGFLSQLLLSSDLAGAQLQAQQIIADELQTAEGERQQQLLTAWNAINGLPAVLAAAAPTGGPGLFVDAWSALRQAQLVSPQVAEALVQLAQAHHLPADLINALAPGL